MSVELVVAIVAAVGLVLAALVAGIVALVTGILSWRSTVRGQDHEAIERLTARVDRIEAENRRLWHENGLLWDWNDELVDHIMQGRPAPPPIAPAGLSLIRDRAAPA
jgi:hypothetical protein